MITTIIFIVIAYLCGSVSTGIVVCKLLRLPDPRTQGSGNTGTTNVLRVGGKKAAIIVLIGDVLKGFLPVLIAKLLHVEALGLGLVALAAFLGHLYPLYFKFKGGKGVATAIGVIFALSPLLGLFLVITWLIVAVLFKYSSLAALVSAIMVLLYEPLFTGGIYFWPLLVIILLIIWRHRENIQRLIKGTESKIKLRKEK